MSNRHCNGIDPKLQKLPRWGCHHNQQWGARRDRLLLGADRLLLLPELELLLLPLVLELLLLELLQMPLLHRQGSLGKPSAWHWRWVLAKFKLSVRNQHNNKHNLLSHLLVNCMPLALINDLMGSNRHVLGTESARWQVLVESRVFLQVGRVGLGLVHGRWLLERLHRW